MTLGIASNTLPFAVARLLEENADYTVPEMARTLNVRPHKVRYALRTLKEQNLISRRPCINAHQLGLLRCSVFISLAGGRKQEIDRFIGYLKSCPGVALLLELGGEYQFEVNLVARSVVEFYSLLELINKEFKSLIHHKTFAIQVRHTVYGTRSLALPQRIISEMDWIPAAESHSIDALDHKLLGLISNNAPDSMYALAKLAGKPYATVEQRAIKLKRAGILMPCSVLLHFSAILHSVILIYGHGASEGTRKRVDAFARRHSQVFYLVECLGPWDYELGICVLSPSDASLLVRTLYDELGDIVTETKLLTLFARHKVADYPFVDK